MRRGVILLTEGRSGSNWVGSLAGNASLGNSGEWLDSSQLGVSPRKVDFDTFSQAVLAKGSSDGNDFFVKVFPQHLFSLRRFYKQDFIRTCLEREQTQLLILTRRDRLRQAISFSRGLQSQQWTSRREAKAEPEYDFDQICRCYFLIGRSYDFWDSYAAAQDLPVQRFVYEDLVPDPSPFLRAVADAMGKPAPQKAESELKIQRDATTEEWVERFKADMRVRDILDNLTPSRPARRTLSNLTRFLRARQLKPLPYSY